MTTSTLPPVLLVEDSPEDRDLTLHAFQRSRLVNPVHTVRDGVEALDYLFRRGEYVDRDPSIVPRVILLDIKLPLMTGIEVLRALKADASTRHIPVVMLTSSAEDRDLKECYELGANSYVVKSVDVDQFFDNVQELGSYWLVLNHPEQR